MPKRHGFSHGLATFISIISGGILVGLLRVYLPLLVKMFDRVGLWLSEILEKHLGIEYSPQLLSTAVFAALMAFLWGVAFAFLYRHQLKDRD
ncbi:MAG: hypothetical protein D6813_13865 [Calditrichaeota bacterium]|nr:MAG: hypothetical protein D6813_13865 [Calditrichota bacterium]